MGKHKIIKSAAAVALTASVVATAAPGASAASYKTNAKDQLVHTSTGKLVKGWKVFGGKLYKNGKLAPAKKYKIIGTGAAQKLFYGPTLKKGYKTASSKTLLFKDGKLADGWKQAGKGERLYKNGKLDKGYTVYTNVEGDKFLYQNGYLKKGQKTANRGGETLLFVDGKLAKGYVLHEASKTLFNNGKVAEGLVKYPEKDGKFYNDGKLANGEINGAEYKDGVLVAKDIASVKAINGTTVEVTFKEAQKADDVKAADYKIEGLEVKNAAVKQTDSKVVVLTTSAQEAAKEYTLVYKEADTKTFTGVSAVIPTAVKITKGSQQGVIGKEVTVEAQVTVAEGQSKAGIPVTIVVDSNKDTNAGGSNNVASDKKVEVYTDENGVAKYSYTQYADDSIDTVNAYPTGDASVKSVTGKVYWGQAQRLSVTDVTEGSTFANDSKKVYKVKVTDAELLKLAKTGSNQAKVFVTFAENVDVKPENVNKDAKIVDVAFGNDTTPYQVTTGGKQEVAVQLDKDGEATFTVQGTETTVTPIVYKDVEFLEDGDNDATESTEGTLQATELQAKANSVTFAKNYTNQLDIAAAGTQNAAKYKTAPTATTDLFADDAANFGGRTYVTTILGKDGKPAPAGTVVNFTFKKGDFSTDKKVYAQGYVTTGSYAQEVVLGAHDQSQSQQFTTTVTGNEGKAVIKIVGTADAFAKPTVYLDNGQGNDSKPGALDAIDLQKTGEVVYFLDKAVKNAKLESNAPVNKKVAAGKDVTFTYTALDQNENAYETDEAFTTTFQVTATSSDATVTVPTGYTLKDGATGKTISAETVKAGQTRSFQVTSLDKVKAQIIVTSTNKSTVDVQASASASSLPNKVDTVEFVTSYAAELKEVSNKLGLLTHTTGATVTNATELQQAKKQVDAVKTAIEAAKKAGASEDEIKALALYGDLAKQEAVIAAKQATVTSTALTTIVTSGSTATEADYIEAGLEIKDLSVTQANVATQALVTNKGTADLTKEDVQAILDVEDYNLNKGGSIKQLYPNAKVASLTLASATLNVAVAGLVNNSNQEDIVPVAGTNAYFATKGLKLNAAAFAVDASHVLTLTGQPLFTKADGTAITNEAAFTILKGNKPGAYRISVMNETTSNIITNTYNKIGRIALLPTGEVTLTSETN